MRSGESMVYRAGAFANRIRGVVHVEQTGHATPFDIYRERIMCERAPSNNGFEDVRCPVRLCLRVNGHVRDKLRTDHRR